MLDPDPYPDPHYINADPQSCSAWTLLLTSQFFTSCPLPVILLAFWRPAQNMIRQRKVHLSYSFFGNCVTSVPISTFMCLWAIYLVLGSVHIYCCSKIDGPILKIYKSLTDIWVLYRNWEAEHYNSVLEIRRLHTAQFHFWEYINGKQTFILDSHRPFICSAYWTNPLTSCLQPEILASFWHPWLPTFCPQPDILSSTWHSVLNLTFCPQPDILV